jgi:hypothetical protein
MPNTFNLLADPSRQKPGHIAEPAVWSAPLVLQPGDNAIIQIPQVGLLEWDWNGDLGSNIKYNFSLDGVTFTAGASQYGGLPPNPNHLLFDFVQPCWMQILNGSTNTAHYYFLRFWSGIPASYLQATRGLYFYALSHIGVPGNWSYAGPNNICRIYVTDQPGFFGVRYNPTSTGTTQIIATHGVSLAGVAICKQVAGTGVSLQITGANNYVILSDVSSWPLGWYNFASQAWPFGLIVWGAGGEVVNAVLSGTVATFPDYVFYFSQYPI